MGDRYRHALEFGNENYKGGPTKLVNPNVGVQKAGRLLLEHPIVLMCACWKWSECHRTLVAKLLVEEFQVEVVHLDRKSMPRKVIPKPPHPQGLLF